MDRIMNTDIDVANHWLGSGQTIRICGLDLRPLAHPIFNKTVWCITKGQATVFFLEQVPRGKIWLLKKFNPGRRPTDGYLQAVSDHLPGGAEFFTCTQRRLLRREHLDRRNSTYRKTGLESFIGGAVLMPKVPGTTWASIADDLRDGSQVLSVRERLGIGLTLAKCVALLEAGHCSHRDLSSTNLFVAPKGEVFLIDWDCIYHPDLEFQSNTTIGTMGYIAPFADMTKQDSDASWSWCECADRFALAVLIAEILLVDQDTPLVQEDGTLFSQAQIDEVGSGIVRKQIKCLRQISWRDGTLLEQAFMSKRFEDCPTPEAWVRALKATLYKQANSQRTAGKPRRQESKRVLCGKCETPFPMLTAKYDQLQKRNKSPLCTDCFESQQSQWASEELQRNMDRPKVLCEHCGGHRPISRSELNNLRSRGKPILCSDCLEQQLLMWKTEQAQQRNMNPHVACTLCGTGFRMARLKMANLHSQGKALLCQECRNARCHSDTRSRKTASTETSNTDSIMANLFERIRKWA